MSVGGGTGAWPKTSDEQLWRVEDDPARAGSDPLCVLPRRVADWATKDPGRPFIEDVGGRSLSYGAFFDELGRWCTYLLSLGVKRGDRLASFLPSSIDAHLLWFAASAVGAIEVPVNRDLRGEFLRHVLADSGARLCFVRPADASLPDSSGVSGLATIVVGSESLVAGLDATLVQLADPADVACVIYTSGTTGPAKGVQVTWGQMSTAAGRLPRSWLRADDAYYSPWPMFHISGRTAALTMAEVGARVVCREHASVSGFWDDVRRYRCTFSVISPIAPLLLAQPILPDERSHPLKWVYCGGPRAVDFQRRFGVRALTSYGSTEMGFPVVKRWTSDAMADRVGFPRPGYEIRLVAEHGASRTGRAGDWADGAIGAGDWAGEPVAPGTPGELWIKPPAPHLITPGYLGQPERTAAVIRDGWYRTGDVLVQHVDGSLAFVDRKGDTIRRFGENISAVAVETAVEREDDVLRCGVVGIPDEVAGAEVLMAVLPVDGCRLDAGAFFERLQSLLPRHALPAYLAIVNEMPLTPNGKLQRSLLAGLRDSHGLWMSPVAIAARRAPSGGE